MNKLKRLLNTSLLSNKHKKYILKNQNGNTDNPVLQITGICNLYDHVFICTSGHSFDDVKNALLAGTLIIVDVVVNPENENLRYITSDISLLYDSGSWFVISKTFTNGDEIDTWIVQS